MTKASALTLCYHYCHTTAVIYSKFVLYLLITHIVIFWIIFFILSNLFVLPPASSIGSTTEYTINYAFAEVQNMNKFLELSKSINEALS